MRTNINKDIVSPPTVRRGDWQIKVSSYKGIQLIVIALHMETDAFIMRVFNSDASAADFINCIIDEGIV